MNGRLRVIPKDVAAAIHDAASEMSFGAYDDQFPVDVFQTGSGTSTNMNANEVLARAGHGAARPARPRQRPRERLPVVQRRVPVGGAPRGLPASSSAAWCPALDHLHAELRRLARAHARTVKAGPHPPHGRRAGDVRAGAGGLGAAGGAGQGAPARRPAPPGRAAARRHRGRAPGSNAPPRFARAVIAALAADMGLPLSEAVDHFEAQSAQDALVEASGAAKVRRALPAQDRRRPAADGLGPGGGAGRGDAAEPAAGQLDHARQGQPGHPRGGAAGGLPGRRERRRHHVRGDAVHVRAEHRHAGDGPQPAGVAPAARRASSPCWPTAAWPASPSTRPRCAATPSPPPRW